MAKPFRKLWVHWLQIRHMKRLGQLGTRKRRTDGVWNDAADHSLTVAVILGLLLWIVCVLVLTLPGRYDLPDLTLGQPAMNTIYAAVNFSYEDTEATRNAREAAAQNGPRCYRIDPQRSRKILDNLQLFLQAVNQRAQAAAASTPLPRDHASPIARQVMDLNPAVFQQLRQLDRDPVFNTAFAQKVQNRVERGLRSNDDARGLSERHPCSIADQYARIRPRPVPLKELPSVRDFAEELVRLLEEYQQAPAPAPVHAVLLQLMEDLCCGQGNLLPDEERTRKNAAEIRAEVKPVLRDVHQNALLIRRGEIAGERHLDALHAHNRRLEEIGRDAVFWKTLVRNVLWSLLLIVFVGFYLYHIHPGLLQSNRQIGLLCTITALALAANFFSLRFFRELSLYLSFPPDLLSYAIPLALSTVMLAVMIGLRVSIYIGFFVALITAMMLRSNFTIALEGMVLAAVVAMAVRSVSNYRAFFVRAFFSVSVCVWLLDFNFLEHLHDLPQHLWHSALLALGNGFFTAVAGLILVFAFEILFNVSTNMSLMAMCDSNHPLLKELHLKATGTSLHCQNVAMLAENAAAEIRANPVRARACALFHDIGKMKAPEYFTENNRDGINMHTSLTPRMSSIIIINHVKDGLDLALQHKLCKPVRDAIRQHHGTDLMHFFYQQALQSPDPVVESDYRYPGPLPHDKEIVIVSLADACEAACRSLDKPNAAKIEAKVEDIFRLRWDEGQLDHAAMTIAELAAIRKSFKETLISMYHSRIAYPKEMEDEDDLFMAKPAAPGPQPGPAKSGNA